MKSTIDAMKCLQQIWAGVVREPKNITRKALNEITSIIHEIIKSEEAPVSLPLTAPVTDDEIDAAFVEFDLLRESTTVEEMRRALEGFAAGRVAVAEKKGVQGRGYTTAQLAAGVKGLEFCRSRGIPLSDETVVGIVYDHMTAAAPKPPLTIYMDDDAIDVEQFYRAKGFEKLPVTPTMTGAEIRACGWKRQHERQMFIDYGNTGVPLKHVGTTEAVILVDGMRFVSIPSASAGVDLMPDAASDQTDSRVTGKATAPPVPEAVKALDVCTDGYNCRRCKTHPNHRGDIPHAGIPMGNSFWAQPAPVPSEVAAGRAAGVAPADQRTCSHEWIHIEPGQPWLSCERCGIDYAERRTKKPSCP